MTTPAHVQAALARASVPADAAGLQRYFKTGPGQYAEGDVFIGVRVPAVRMVARQFADLSPAGIDELLDSEVHEHRLAALVILNASFARVSRPRTFDGAERERLVRLYLAAVRRGRVNNWDLVDVSAENILGSWLLERPRDLLFELAASPSLWERRVALLSTFALIKAGDASATFALAAQLLDDRADLIQKALGWMLREVGKRVSRDELLEFLNANAARMGRIALSYATEHLDTAERARLRALRT